MMAKYYVPNTVDLNTLTQHPPPKLPPKIVMPSHVPLPKKQPPVVRAEPTPAQAIPVPVQVPPVQRGSRIEVNQGFVKLEEGEESLSLDGRALYAYDHTRNEMLAFVRQVAGLRFLETKDLLRTSNEDELRALTELAKYGIDPTHPGKEFANIPDSTMAELKAIRQLMNDFKLSAEDAIAAYRFATQRAAAKTKAIADWLRATSQAQLQILAPSLNSAISKATNDVSRLRKIQDTDTLMWELISGNRKEEFAQLVAKALEQATVSRQGAYNVTNAQVVRVNEEYQAQLFNLRS